MKTYSLRETQRRLGIEQPSITLTRLAFLDWIATDSYELDTRRKRATALVSSLRSAIRSQRPTGNSLAFQVSHVGARSSLRQTAEFSAVVKDGVVTIDLLSIATARGPVKRTSEARREEEEHRAFLIRREAERRFFDGAAKRAFALLAGIVNLARVTKRDAIRLKPVVQDDRIVCAFTARGRPFAAVYWRHGGFGVYAERGKTPKYGGRRGERVMRAVLARIGTTPAP